MTDETKPVAVTEADQIGGAFAGEDSPFAAVPQDAKALGRALFERFVARHSSQGALTWDNVPQSTRDHWRVIASDAAALITRLASVSGWRDIASAPMNKTHLALLRCNEDGSWTYGHGYYMPLEGWRCWQHYAHKPPTHWMPLPEAPTTPHMEDEAHG